MELDGGLAAWNGPTESGDVLPTPAAFTARPWPSEAVATAADVAEAAATCPGR